MNHLKTLVLGGSGLIGTAFLKKIREINSVSPSDHLLTPNSSELDLCQAQKCFEYFKYHNPERVCFFAGISGGVKENLENPLPLMLENSSMINNIAAAIHQTASVSEFIQTLPSCIYPIDASQPYSPSSIGTGPTEPTSQYFAQSKIYSLSLIKALQIQLRQESRQLRCIHVIPSNVYGHKANSLGNPFDPQKMHVIPALVQKFKKAHQENSDFIEIWGSGNQLRDFLHADDFSEALKILTTTNVEKDIFNVAPNQPTSIMELAFLIKKIVGYEGQIHFKNSQLAGAATKILDTKDIQALGWAPKINLEKGLQDIILT